MNEIRSLDGLSGFIPAYSQSVPAEAVEPRSVSFSEDRLDLSPEALEFTETSPQPGDRAARLSRIKESIARGTYLTDAKINTALQRALVDAHRAEAESGSARVVRA